MTCQTERHLMEVKTRKMEVMMTVKMKKRLRRKGLSMILNNIIDAVAGKRKKRKRRKKLKRRKKESDCN